MVTGLFKVRIGAPASSRAYRTAVTGCGQMLSQQLWGGTPSSAVPLNTAKSLRLYRLRKNCMKMDWFEGLLHQNPSPKGAIPVAHVA